MSIANMLTTEELAEQLSSNARTLANWRITGYGPKFVKVGYKVRYRQSDVDSWLESRTFETTTEAAVQR